MDSKGNSLRWAGFMSIASGVVFLVPLIFYFILLPAAGSSADHAKDPASFLPWMTEQGSVRIALWWIVCLAFVLVLFGAPYLLRRRLQEKNPAMARISELAGILGSFAIVVAGLMLAAGELPIASAFVEAGEESRSAIIALYEWQRLTTALLFDVLGFFFLGVWVALGSLAGLRSRDLPKSIGIFGLITSVLCFCFALGYAAQIGWLGEFGVGVGVFVALPAWLIWLGIISLR